MATAGGSDTAAANSAPAGTSPSLRFCNFEDFFQHLDIDQAADRSGLVMAAAQHMFAAPLPPQWTEQVDEDSSRVYFFNSFSGQSLWMHPQESIFKELIEEVKTWQPHEPMETILARAEAHLRKAQRDAVEAMGQWSAYDSPPAPEEGHESGESSQFFFNSTTGESSWADPRQNVEFDLRQRHRILCECMSDFGGLLASPSDSSEGENKDQMDQRRPHQSPSDRPKPQAFGFNLSELLGTLSLPLQQAAGPPDAALPSGGRPAHLPLPAGDDTVRSSMSYLTARSNGSNAEEGQGDLSARLL
eukprot:TRINITY_DN66295_c0_g1_i1.p1 TRINITY_DN66295_c0_g1~~TRINITY_DN66295_c0_g1_i1.p1  ORF type:complete len:302 (+),score=68.15 TRINITY_DN66295_c0_g1_i1:34-939(+)